MTRLGSTDDIMADALANRPAPVIEESADEAPRFNAGDAVMFTRQVDRFPDFCVQPGSTGKIDEFKPGDAISVILDAPHEGAEEWGNALVYAGPETYSFFADIGMPLRPSNKTNCLEGIRCPRCLQTERFVIQATATFVLTDDGTEMAEGDTDWNELSPISCGDPDCCASGTVADFSDAAIMEAAGRVEADDDMPSLETCHDALSEALENPDASNDDVRRAALIMCDALNEHWERERMKKV